MEQSSGAWKSSWVKTQTSLLTEMTSVSGEMNSVTRCWTDTSAPKKDDEDGRHPVAEGGPAHIQHDLLLRVSKVRQALDTAVATLAVNPSSRPISFSHPGRPSPFSLITLRSARDSPFELVRPRNKILNYNSSRRST